MDVEIALKTGYLFTPPQTFLRKTWSKKYCVLYEASQQGIQRLEIFENDDALARQSPSKIIPLNDCWKVAAYPLKNQPNVFEVRRKEERHQFSTDTFQEMLDWLSALQSVAFAKNSTTSAITPAVCEKQEENFLYSTVAEPERYRVKIQPTEASLRNELFRDYDLLITTVSIALEDEDGRLVLKWPYRHIRRYGCAFDNFSFEAGRKCDSGEGIFIFETNSGSQIFKKVDSHVSSFQKTQAESLTLRRNEHRSSLPSPTETQNTYFNTRPPVKKPPRKNKLDAHSLPNFNRYEIEKFTQSSSFSGNREAIRDAESAIKCANNRYNVNYLEERQLPGESYNEPHLYENALLLDTAHTNRKQTLDRSSSDNQIIEPFNLELLQNSLTDKLHLTSIEPPHYVKNDVEYARIAKKE
ncbi:docking protein 1 [Parasteatoda tepidariorum]|uniref:docking protein 1 n=1 Tax=Parasteatoda tepidariorum TaxID=114398 RepID=UPI00077FA5DE|nr:docking protein 1 [Parasteatoda tepidariorum]